MKKWMEIPAFREDAVALRMVAVGEATPEQQRRAMRFIIEDICATYDMSYKPDDSDGTVFSEGRRFAGNRIVYYIKCKLEKLESSGGRRKQSLTGTDLPDGDARWGYTKSGQPRRKPGRKPREQP